MGIKILKFGGSSVETLEKMEYVAKKVIKEKEKNDEKYVIVVSAMGKKTKNLYENAKRIAKNPRGRELDLLLATGEIVAISYLGIILNDLGYKAIALTGKDARIYTSGAFQSSKIINIDTSVIKKHLDLDEIVIVAGYQGVNENGDITTLGKEGSDTTAINLAYYLNGDCTIYTDVNYVYEVDPKIIKDAMPHKQLSFLDLLAFAKAGAKVIAKSAIEFAYTKKINFSIKSTFVETEGTYVGDFVRKDFVGITSIDNVYLVKNNLTKSFQEELLKDGITIENYGEYLAIYSNDYYDYKYPYALPNLKMVTIVGKIVNNIEIQKQILQILATVCKVYFSYHKENSFSIFINKEEDFHLINKLYYFIKERLL